MQNLEVRLSDQTGLPYADVPLQAMWELVEFLSYQRVAVSYEYHGMNFTVCFVRSDMTTAQRLLDDWAKIESKTLQEVG